MSDVVELGPHDRMTTDEALEYAKRRGLKELIVVGYDQDGDFVVVSSHLSRSDALWLAVHLVDHTKDKL